MPERTFADVLRELMDVWDRSRAEWIEKYGTDKGFADWYTDQVLRPVSGPGLKKKKYTN